MSEPFRVPPDASASADPRWELTLRVAESSTFRNCPKLRAFLLHVCENAILGRLENVREQQIGSKVFGRPTGYNLGEDNIVRVEARELRKRLEAHFAGEGRHETCTIEIPKGGYVPVFKPREPLPAETAEVKEEPPAGAPASGPAFVRPLPWRRIALIAGIVVPVALAVWLASTWLPQQVPPHPQGARSGAAAGQYSIYSDLLGAMGTRSEREILIVLSNPLVMPYGGTPSDRFIDMPGSAAPAPRVPLQLFTKDEYTGTGEATAAFHVGRLMQFMHRRVRLTQARFLNWDHIQQQDLIFLGGPQVNDWTYQNLRRSNFNIASTRLVENQKPLAGEAREYAMRPEPRADARTALTDYGVIKMLTSPEGFQMLLVAGITSAGTAGVGEFFASPEKMKEAYAGISAATRGKPFPANWEVLVKVSVRDNLPVDTAAVAFRPAAAQRATAP